MQQSQETPQEVLESILLLLAEVGEAVVLEARLAQSNSANDKSQTSSPANDLMEQGQPSDPPMVDQFGPRLVHFR